MLATSDSIQIREKVLNNGSKRYFIDQELNENSIVLWPGGLFENRYIICGHIASVYSNDFSKRIISMISKEMRKYCTKIGNYYIGNEAYEYRTRYRFITMNIHEPLEYDFKICE